MLFDALLTSICGLQRQELLQGLRSKIRMLRLQRLPRRVRIISLIRKCSSTQADSLELLVEKCLDSRDGSGNDDTDAVVRLVRRVRGPSIVMLPWGWLRWAA